MTEPTYEIEDIKPKRAGSFIKSRAAKIPGITVGAAIALVAAFGVGVIAGEKMAGNGTQMSGQFGQGGPGFGGNGFRPDGDHKFGLSLIHI